MRNKMQQIAVDLAALAARTNALATAANDTYEQLRALQKKADPSTEEGKNIDRLVHALLNCMPSAENAHQLANMADFIRYAEWPADAQNAAAAFDTAVSIAMLSSPCRALVRLEKVPA